MQQTPELENQGQRWVTLVSPEDEIGASFPELGFIGQKKELGDLGMGRLYGRKEEFWDYNLGITIDNGKLVVAKANSLRKRNLYNIDVFIYPHGQPMLPTTCQLLLPDGTILEDDMYFDEDKVDPDRRTRYKMAVCGNDWRVLGDSKGKEYIFFAPADPKFLSTLKFSFKSNMEMSMLETLAS